MKTAIVYDYVPGHGGGAERALLELIKHFAPDVDVYFGFVVDTPFSRDYLSKLRTLYTPTRIHTGQVLKSFKIFGFRILNFLLPAILQSIALQKYDLVISYTAFLSHSIIPPAKGKHILYMNTPARFLWNLSHAQSWLKKVTSVFRITDLMRFRSKLYDLAAIEKTPTIWAISEAVAKRIKTFYNRSSEVLYPASGSEEIFAPDYYSEALQKRLGEFICHISRVESYKNVDLVIDYAIKYPTENTIIIAGDGPYLKHLLKRAKTAFLNENLEIPELGVTAKKCGPLLFTGMLSEEAKLTMLATAKATLSLNDEDFGITKVEPIALGTPVVALNAGAASEIIRHGQNGLLFEKADVEALAAALRLLGKMKFDKQMVRKTAVPFTTEAFHANLDKLVNA